MLARDEIPRGHQTDGGDAVVASRRDEWRGGVECLPRPERRRNVVLSDCAFVRGAAAQRNLDESDSFDRLNSRENNAALLRRAGVTVILESDSYGDGSHFNSRNVRFEAGNAVANGMTWDDALRAVTAAPAEIFGVADRIGTLAPDLDANVVVWSGDPFEFATRAEAVFIGGVRVDGPDRQKELMERYR